jgi:pimeloyl-ACP methyl ester carboxylesterase
MKTTQSKDGTTLAYEVTGTGPALVLVGGAFLDRTSPLAGTPLAAMLADQFTVYSYDRRGRGASSDTRPYAADREIEDLAAIVAVAGSSVNAYGMSSGGLLVLDAVARGIALSRIVVYEPPMVIDPVRIAQLEALLPELERASRSDAAELFMTRGMGMPAAAVAGMKATPAWRDREALAHTLAYDVRIAIRPRDLAAVRVPVLVVAGGASPPWMRDGLERLSRALPYGELRVLEEQTHGVDPRLLASVIRSAA